MGSLIDLARQNTREILNGGFSSELTITPTGLGEVVINGLTTSHSSGFDSDGLPVIGPNSHCSFSELDLNDKGIVTRNAKNDLIVRGWDVRWTDQLGTYNCKMSEPMPDRGLGYIKVMLSQTVR